jgi:hypothetical protein
MSPTLAGRGGCQSLIHFSQKGQPVHDVFALLAVS